jgi:ribosomal subunit interface protein
MKLDALKATNIELTDAIKSAVEDALARLAKFTERYGTAVSAHVEVGKSTQHHHKGPFFRAEINLKIPGTLLRAEREREDLYVALNEVESDLARQLKAEKER